MVSAHWAIAASPMTEILVGGLLLLAFFLGAGWKKADAENEKLRRQVTWLKRRLEDR